MHRYLPAHFRGELMSRFTIPVYILALAGSPLLAQPLPNQPVKFSSPNPAELPPRPSLVGTAPDKLPAVLENRISFSPDSIEVKQNNFRWQIWAGKTLVKDFAENRDNAYEARRLIADLKLTERNVIGTPDPVMEYWLTGDAAPPP